MYVREKILCNLKHTHKSESLNPGKRSTYCILAYTYVPSRFSLFLNPQRSVGQESTLAIPLAMGNGHGKQALEVEPIGLTSIHFPILSSNLDSRISSSSGSKLFLLEVGSWNQVPQPNLHTRGAWLRNFVGRRQVLKTITRVIHTHTHMQ
jgi:hypothetical protein